MLTPHAKDPERENELIRKAAQPASFGRTAIQKTGQETITIISDDEAEAKMQEIKGARNALVAKQELLAQAESQLADLVSDKKAKPKDVEALEDKVDALEDEVSALSVTLFDLIG